MGKNIAVLASGSGTNAENIIRYFQNSELVNVELVLTNRESAFVLERARSLNVPFACMGKAEWMDGTAVLSLLENRGIDFIVLAGFLARVPDCILHAYPNKIINIHPSLIPSFCGPGHYGMHVHEKVLARGVKVTGATVHFVSSEVDGGPIILQEACNIDDLDNAEDIQARVLEIEHRILPKAVALFCDGKIIVENERAKVI